MRFLLAIFLCLICTCVNAGSNKDADSNILAGYLLDWGTSRTAKNADCSGEQDSLPMLSDCPSTKSIDIFYLTSALAHLGVKKLLPEEYSRFLGGSNVNVSAFVDRDSTTSISFRMSF
ncbi:MAG: hypothetical protein R3240_09135 [Gammaproteobacteria bacterium]|nr:hypothetical protein [Gammaproteobacteria bacterium]